jgi:predicted ATPase
MKDTARVIVTGGPGTGKTSLIESLRAEGYNCFTERARAIIREQLDLGTDLVPWENLVDFSALVQERQIHDHKQAAQSQINFYDRGAPDVLAYLHKANLYVKNLEENARKHLYFSKVFITPPWEQIYEMDEERREDMASMYAIHHALVNTYETIGYEVLEVPKVSVSDRLDFIKKAIGI